MNILIADSGSTKCEWCLLGGKKPLILETQGASPYFLNKDQLVALFRSELQPGLKKKSPDKIFFYGTGCVEKQNQNLLKAALRAVFPGAAIQVTHDLMGAARALCGDEKGVAAILGTGCNSASYNGKKIILNSPGLGYVLGDEGSGAYLGKMVIQHFLYETFDEDLKSRFNKKYGINAAIILDAVYRKPLPNRYIASFTLFLAENRGHYMIENIIEDGLEDFFFTHLRRYPESEKYPVHFTGSVAFGFRDKIKELCIRYGWKPGRILRKPMDGLITYHKAQQWNSKK